MEKTKLEKIKELEEKIEQYEKQSSELSEMAYKTRRELDKLYAPEIPMEMMGKYIKQTGKFSTTYLHIEYINSSGDFESEDWRFVRFCGFGWSVNDRGHIHFSNREIISDRNEDNKTITEISQDEFEDEFNKALIEARGGLDWSKEFD